MELLPRVDSADRVGDALSDGDPAVQVMVVLGTRPEAVKLAPLVHALERDPRTDPVVVTTGQHPEMVQGMLEVFGVVPAHRLDAVISGERTLDDIASGVLLATGELFEVQRPDLVVVQGDTTTTMAAALAAFHGRIPVVHIEAGLRTGDLSAPFPEEANRKIVSAIAALHLAPTAGARDALLSEGVDPARVVVTGNTVVDALRWMVHADVEGPDAAVLDQIDARRRLALVTMHRRESWGDPMRAAVGALADLAATHSEDVQFLVTMHPNPIVRDAITEALGDHPNVLLTEPLSYPTFARVLARAAVVVTDSGGVQEEAPTFGVPVVVLREVTERPEAVRAGLAELVGTDPARIIRAFERGLERSGAPDRVSNPYGDGQAAPRSVAAIAWHLGLRDAQAPDELAV